MNIYPSFQENPPSSKDLQLLSLFFGLPCRVHHNTELPRSDVRKKTKMRLLFMHEEEAVANIFSFPLVMKGWRL